MKCKKAILSFTVISGLLFTGFHSGTVKADSTEGFAGKWSGKPNKLNLAASLSGDILFGYKNDCSYGKFTHAAMVVRGSTKNSSGVWDGPIVESTSGKGKNSVISNRHQRDFLKYDAASLTYFNKSGYSFSGTKIADKAKKYKGPYNVFSSYKSNDAWYCSKLVSRAVYDYNGYKLGSTYVGKFMVPSSVWYDSALGQRAKSLSTKYDGGSVWAKPKSTAATILSSHSTGNNESNTKEIKYKGYKVYTNNFDSKAKKLVDERIKAEQTLNKNVNKDENHIVLSDAKPGLDDFLRELLKEGKITKKEIKKKWGLSDSELKNL